MKKVVNFRLLNLPRSWFRQRRHQIR